MQVKRFSAKFAEATIIHFHMIIFSEGAYTWAGTSAGMMLNLAVAIPTRFVMSLQLTLRQVHTEVACFMCTYLY